MGVMANDKVNLVAMFMLSVVATLLINYPSVDQQCQRVDAHAKAVLMVANTLLTAGVPTGIMSESSIFTAVAKAAVGFIPSDMAHHTLVVLGVLSMPSSLLFDLDLFYFGILPVVAETSKMLGVAPVYVVQATVLDQMTTGFSVNPLTPATFLAVGLCGIELADRQRFSIPSLFSASLLITAVAVVLGVLPW